MRIKSKNTLFLLLIIIVSQLQIAAIFSPENPSKISEKPLVQGSHSMIVTNNPWASKTAAAILELGGNAIDAAIAAGFVLALTEPQSSGLGGGGYAITYDVQNKKLTAYDGREVAPHSATPNLFLDNTKKPINLNQAVLSIKSIGVPSEVALFYTLHKKQGKLAWKLLLNPAIQLARHGFPMNQRLFHLLSIDEGILKNNPAIKNIYFQNNHIKPIGSIITNIDLAKTLMKIANNPHDFYHGKLARELISYINQKARTTLFNKKDFEHYQVKIYPPLCMIYRNKFKICSVPPSSSGGVTVNEILAIYARNYDGTKINDPFWWYHFIEASKLSFADRNQYIADPDFIHVPVTEILSNKYLDQRSREVGKRALITPVKAGILQTPPYAMDNSKKNHGTTSLTIVDKDGNAISLTVTIEHQFGSHYFTHGFFMNNELTDFSFAPTDQNHRIIANSVERGKRPRSSIAPVMVFDKQNKLYALTGSPGGSEIICYVAKNLILMLDMGVMPDKASASTNLCTTNNNPVIEKSEVVLPQITVLQSLGEQIERQEMVSGVTNIIRNPKGGWFGAADKRREGIAIGN
jgi:gamma-glutamyltranspeptidase/glutathione hydrolase